MKGTFHWTFPPIILLLRTIWSRPKLAEYIVDIDIRSGEGSWDGWKHDYTKYFTDSEKESLVMFLKSFPFDLKDKWAKQIEVEGSFDAYIALLTQLPHVKTISLTGEFWKSTELLGSMFRTALHRQSPPEADGSKFSTPTQRSDKHILSRFQHLESIRATSSEQTLHNPRSNNSSDVMAFFNLPSLKNLSVAWSNRLRWGGDEDGYRLDPLVWQEGDPQQTKITSLDVKVLREQNLAKVLARTPRLRKLKWEFWDAGSGSPDGPFDCAALSEALTNVQNTLEDLKIKASYERRGNRHFMSQQPDSSRVNGALNLSGFNNLRKLEVPLMTLLGPGNREHFADVLPKYVEHVIFTTDGFFKYFNFDSWYWEPEDLVKEFQTWLWHWKEITPHLKRVEIRWLAEWGPEALRAIDLLLTKAGRRYAIEFVLKNDSDYEKWGTEWERREDPWHASNFKFKRLERHYEITNRETFDSLHTHVLRPTEREIRDRKITVDRRRAHEAENSDDEGPLNLDFGLELGD